MFEFRGPEPVTMPDLSAFQALLGEAFEIRFSDAIVRLSLAEANAIDASGRSGARDPFSLIFHGSDGVMLQGQTYLLHHHVTGDLPIFITPVGRLEGETVYQAVFN